MQIALSCLYHIETCRVMWSYLSWFVLDLDEQATYLQSRVESGSSEKGGVNLLICQQLLAKMRSQTRDTYTREVTRYLLDKRSALAAEHCTYLRQKHLVGSLQDAPISLSAQVGDIVAIHGILVADSVLTRFPSFGAVRGDL